MSIDFPDTKYWQRYRGAFSGVLKWQDVDRLWEGLKNSPEHWYVFDPAEEAPNAPVNGKAFLEFLDKAETLLHQRRDRPSCGAVYVDVMTEPTYIKIFDPVNMGTSCGGDHDPVMPRWIVSKMVPDTLPPPPEERLTIVQRLLRRSA